MPLLYLPFLSFPHSLFLSLFLRVCLFSSNNTSALPRSRCGVSAQDPVVVSIIQAAISGPVSSSGHVYPGPSVELGVLWLHGYFARLSGFPRLSSLDHLEFVSCLKAKTWTDINIYKASASWQDLVLQKWPRHSPFPQGILSGIGANWQLKK